MIYLNNESCEDYGLIVKELINIPAAEKNVKEVTIPGRDGSLYEDEGTYKDISIPIEFNFLSQEGEWNSKWRQAKAFLDQTGKLVQDDDIEYFYIVKNIILDAAARTEQRVGSFTATFVCDPFCYSQEGLNELLNPKQLNNNGYTTSPIYRIEGEGNCTLTVNGNSFTANIHEKIYIDVGLEIAYNKYGESANTSVAGIYEELKLIKGENTLSVTSGFSLYVIPRWRYR